MTGQVTGVGHSEAVPMTQLPSGQGVLSAGGFAVGAGGHSAMETAQVESNAHLTGLDNGQVGVVGHSERLTAHEIPADAIGQVTKKRSAQFAPMTLEQSVRQVPSAQRVVPSGQVM